jgi:hypothetical protein
LSLPLTSPVEVTVSKTLSKKSGTTLVYATHIEVGSVVLEVVLLAVFCAPEGQIVSIDGIVGSATDQPERCDVLIIVELMNDGLVEL